MDKTYWFFVTEGILHISNSKQNDETWWCVDRRCKIGDKAFLYQKQKGVICYFEILEIDNSQSFCRSYSMGTGLIKILIFFKEPITAKKMKSNSTIRKETFISRNFQGKSFVFKEEDSVEALISL